MSNDRAADEIAAALRAIAAQLEEIKNLLRERLPKIAVTKRT